jgi:hypothetical protein
VVLGGGGTVTGNNQVDNNWFKINSAISNAVADRLTANGYDVRPLIIDIRDGDERFRALWSKLSETHCDRTVQISHLLKASNGRVDSFSIQGEVLIFDSPVDGKAGVKPISEYEKGYDFAMSPAVMQNLSLSQLGYTIADGIVAAGALPKR